VGTDPDVDVDGFAIEAEEGDIFLLCSDGLTDMVEDEEILELVHRNRDDLDRAVQALVSAANRGGGEDNITAVAFRMTSDTPATSLEDTAAMPAIDFEEPDEETREYGEADEHTADADADSPAPDARRVRIVLIGLVLVGIAVALLVWEFLR